MLLLNQFARRCDCVQVNFWFYPFDIAEHFTNGLKLDVQEIRWNEVVGH